MNYEAKEIAPYDFSQLKMLFHISQHCRSFFDHSYQVLPLLFLLEDLFNASKAVILSQGGTPQNPLKGAAGSVSRQARYEEINK